LLVAAGAAFAAGPPFPDPIPGIVVYDEAGIFSDATEAEATAIIEAIEARTGAEVVVYAQTKPGVGDDGAAADAQALGNSWGVGRAGFDDGLVILFDMEEGGEHGSVRIEPGAGFRAAYLGQDESQAIFDLVMLPYLREGSIDEALLAGLRAVDASVVADETWKLEAARLGNAVLGLIVAPILGLGLLGFLAWRWYRVGRDPVYTDDPSVLMPAPPSGLSPAGATLLMAGRSSGRQLTTAMIDLASRGEIAFDPEPGLLVTKVAIVGGPGGASTDPYVALARRRSLPPPEAALLAAITRRLSQHDGHLEPDMMVELHSARSAFDNALEREVTDHHWFRERPSRAMTRWAVVGGLELVIAGAALGVGLAVPLSGAVVVAGALGVAGVATLLMATVMPARTVDGARLYAWLSAYRRTLQRTLTAAQSMDDVVASRAVPWLETPDQATVWGVAFGLHDEVEQVLARTASTTATAAAGRGPGLWMPVWYGGATTGGQAAPSGGLFSASAVPSFGGMFAALGSISAGAASSSSGGSGGFGGGGGFSGGGGGGSF
jgi:uncharacterized membrane protein YgcG